MLATVAAVLLSLGSAASVKGPGRLESYPLVYRVPTGYEPYGHYMVFFRTRAGFVGRDDSGTSIPGKLRLEDSYDSHDGFVGLDDKAHCYGWNLGDTSTLDKRRIGSKVALTFELRHTTIQRRTVTLRSAPRGLPHSRWYRHGAVGRSLRAIGCR